jgi:streptogramin lyase
MLTYWHQLYAFVLHRVASQQDAEDIVSEAFVRAYLALKSYPAERVLSLKLRPWLYKITFNEYCRFSGRSTPPQVPFALVIAGASTIWSLLLHHAGGGTPAHSTPAANRSLLFTFYGPRYAVLDPKGNLYVMDSDFQQAHTRILKFSPSGHLLDQWDHFDMDAQPLYIVVDGHGNIYATAQATNSIYKLSATGELLQKWQVVGQEPVGLALDQQDNLYVAVYGGNTIQKYSSPGKLLNMWGTSGSGPGQFNHPAGGVVDDQGNLFVVDQGNDRIQKLTPSGKFVAQWGTTGAGPGQFLRPGSIAIDSKGNIYVTDGSTGLVQQFSSSGKPLAAWGQVEPTLCSLVFPEELQSMTKATST